MSTAPPAVSRLTYQDLVRFPEDGRRHELVDGEHLVTPAPRTRHQRIVGKLYRLVCDHAEAARQGTVLLSPTDVVLSPSDVVELSREERDALSSPLLPGFSASLEKVFG